MEDNNELWFTQTHFAEIRELMRLTEEVKGRNVVSPLRVSADDENEKSGLSVYSGYVGKTIRRKDGFAGMVEDVTTDEKDTYLYVCITEGRDTGKNAKIQRSFILKNRNVYTVSDK